LSLSWAARAAQHDGSDVSLYAGRVADGDIVAGPLVRLACQRHIRDLEDGPSRGLRWDREAAEDVFAFFEKVLRLDDADTPFTLQLWQRFVIGSLFGWKNAAGTRRFRQAYIETAKGSGKTKLVAGVGLFGLAADDEPSAEIYSAAPTQGQASYLFNDAERMVALSPVLRAMIDRRVSNLAHRDSFSFFRPVSSEHRALDGVRVHFGLLDELMEHRSAQVIDKMSAGTKGRTQSLILSITNSGYDRTSVAWAHHEYSRQVVEGTVENEEWFAYVCGLDDGDDPLTDESVWIKANPSVGVTIQPSYLRSQVRKANGIPTATATVLRLNFCCWTRADAPAIDMGLWDSCPSTPLDESELLSAPCFGGLDLGLSNDFSAFVLLWLLPDGRVAVRPTIWTPEAAIDAHPNRPYDAWRREGLLQISSGDVTDFAQVQDTVLALYQRWRVREVAYDQRFASQFAQNLETAGVTMVNVPQGLPLNEACQQLFTLIAQQKLCHEGHGVLAWMASNLTLKHGPQQQVAPDKAAAGDKIDGIVALLMALSRATTAPAPVMPYSERGILTI